MGSWLLGIPRAARSVGVAVVSSLVATCRERGRGRGGAIKAFFHSLVVVDVVFVLVVASFPTAGLFPLGHVFTILLHFQPVRLVVAFTLRVGSQVPRSA